MSSDSVHRTGTSILWWRVIGCAIVIYIFALGYNFLYRGFSPETLVTSTCESLALTAGILIGLSFALSGLTYFFDFLDSKLKYRKQLGLVGYYLALIYAFTVVARYPDSFTTVDGLMSWQVVNGVIAMAIFTLMAVISGNWAIKRLGTHWRPLLRLGYIAYFLLIVRAMEIEGPRWIEWFNTLDSVPPPRLLLSIFAAAVIALRITLAVFLHAQSKNQQAKTEDLPQSFQKSVQ